MTDADLFRQLLEAIGSDDPPALEVAEALADARDLDLVDAQDRVHDALAEGVLVEGGDGYGAVRLADEVRKDTTISGENSKERPEEPDNPDATPTPEAQQKASSGGDCTESWAGAEFSEPESGLWVADQVKREQWMGHKPGDKQPFSPWADPDAPVECTHHEDTTCDECGHSAQFKWGYEGNYTDHEEALTWVERDPRLAGLAFIQREDDPLAFVDGDDVRCPETGEVHPVFQAFLEHLGVTYADISVSGAGVHAVFRGELPEGVKEAKWEIDDEPWGANEDEPSIEIYDGKHVCITTGEHVPGTPESASDWDDDALEAILRANGQLGTHAASADQYDDFDAEDYDATATASDEKTDDVRDIYAALDRLDAQRVAERTIVDEWLEPSHAEYRAFVPTWAPSGYQGTANFATSDVWKDTGTRGGKGGPACMAAIDAGLVSDRQCPERVDGETWWKAVDHLRDLGFDIPEYVGGSEDVEPELAPEDVLDSDTTLSRREAWRAAEAVGPEHLDAPIGLDAVGDGWACPTCGDTVNDGVRALAVAEGPLECCRDPLADPAAYDRHYAALRDDHGAPLPEYIPPTQAVEDYDQARGAAEALRGWDLLDGMDSQVTDDSPFGDDAVAEIDPSWEHSESGERIVLFDSGVFYCREHDSVFWPLQLVALEQGLIDSEDAYLRGDDWLRAYALARTEYGAPLPPIVWNDAEEAPEPLYLPVLPDPDDLLGEGVTTDSSALDEARDEVQELYRDLARSGENHLLTVLPALGKSYAAVVEASDHPTLYAAERKELRKEAAERAADHGVTHMHVPTLGESRPPEAVLSAAVAYVHDHGRAALRDREGLLEAVEDAYAATGEPWPAYEEKYGDEDDQQAVASPEGDADDDEVVLDRAACGCGNGQNGPEWHLATWTARKLGLKPRDIHVRGEAIFGDAPPCTDPECPYTEAWDQATDPENPKDLLIGHPVHAYVQGARSQPVADGDDIYVEDRVVVFDEFPGDAYTREFGENADQHARWLAGCLDSRVEDVTDMLDHRGDLWTDEFVRAWLDGDASPAVLEAIQANRRRAEDTDDDADWTAVRDQLDEAPVYGDLRALVERAVDAAAEDYHDAKELLDAAVTALQGGRQGADALASGAEDGYAHPAAFWLLLGVLAPEDADRTTGDGDDVGLCDIVTAGVRDAEHFTLGSDNGRIKAVSAGGSQRVLLDRDLAGADLLLPPDLARNTVVGLDATGRVDLWELALGSRFDTADIHDTDAERRAFLREVLNLRVAQTTPHVHTYSGSPTSKNFGDDLALVESVADEFGGQQVAQDRLTTTTAPAVVTTKKVEDYLGSQLTDAGAASVDHYGDLIGSNRLAEHSVGVILGAEHYGHDEAERWALLAGQEFSVEGTGTELDYGSDAANALLRRMREDKVMQSIMRFGRDEEGAVVFAHTAALRDDLPVVAQGDVATAWTDAQATIAEAAADLQGSRFGVDDVVQDDRVDCSRRTVRRTLNRFADAGYLRVERGHTNEYVTVDDPGPGEADLPEVSTPDGATAGSDDSGQDGIENTNTWFVWSCDADSDPAPRTGTDTVTLGPPRGARPADPPG